MSIRVQKVSEQVKRVIAKPINDIASEVKAGMVTITSAKVTPDLQIAKIYISSFGGKITPIEFLTILESRKGEIRHYLGTQIRMRFTPDLLFFYDDTLDQIEHIQKLIDSVK
jgi:ribosome-binding factor A